MHTFTVTINADKMLAAVIARGGDQTSAEFKAFRALPGAVQDAAIARAKRQKERSENPVQFLATATAAELDSLCSDDLGRLLDAKAKAEIEAHAAARAKLPRHMQGPVIHVCR